MTTLSLPFSGRTPLSRETSYRAAVSASVTRGPKLQRMAAYFQEHKEATDEELAVALNLPRSSICSLRNKLIGRGLVTERGRTRRGQYGHAVTIWEWLKCGLKKEPTRHGC